LIETPLSSSRRPIRFIGVSSDQSLSSSGLEPSSAADNLRSERDQHAAIGEGSKYPLCIDIPRRYCIDPHAFLTQLASHAPCHLNYSCLTRVIADPLLVFIRNWPTHTGNEHDTSGILKSGPPAAWVVNKPPFVFTSTIFPCFSASYSGHGVWLLGIPAAATQMSILPSVSPIC